MSIAAINVKRSVSLKGYWKAVHAEAERRGISTHQARAEMKDRIIPTSHQNHFSGMRYHYVLQMGKKKGGRYTTITSDRPMTEKQLKDIAARDFTASEQERHEAYGSTDPQYWSTRDFKVDRRMSSIDYTIKLKGEKSTHYDPY